jgi:hypothetical protein
VDISIPVPAGITEADIGKIFFAREVEVLGQKRVMIIDSAVITNGRITTACVPFEDRTRQIDGRISILRTLFESTPALINGTVAGANTVILAGELCYIPDNYYYVFPVPVDSTVLISEINPVTGDILLKKEIQTPSLSGQVYSFQGIPGGGSFSSDITPPLIVQSQGILIFGFDVGGQVIEYQGMTFTPQKDTIGHIIGIEIIGKPGTSVVKRSDDPAGLPRGLIRVYKLEKPEGSPSYEYNLISSIDANNDGSFSRSLLPEEQEGEPVLIEGDRVLVTVEKGETPLDQEFVLVFSEPLFVNVDINNININETGEPGNNLPIIIKDVTDPENSEDIQIQTRLLNSGTEVRIKPLRGNQGQARFQ